MQPSRGGERDRVDELELEVAALRDRLSRLSEASVRINESLDFETVMQGILDSARSLTGARFGLVLLRDGLRREQDFFISGGAPHEHKLFVEWAKDQDVLFDFVIAISGPVRGKDFNNDAESAGVPKVSLPLSARFPMAYLLAPILYRGVSVGSLCVAEPESAREFAAEDEEILVMLASQAAMVIANARRYRDEQRARADLETLINMSPVGVALFDAATGNLVSANREVRRIASELAVGLSLEEILEIVTFRRASGQVLSLSEYPLIETLASGEIVRVEEMVLQVPDGGSAIMLVNGTPIHAPEGHVESVVVTLQDMTAVDELAQLRAKFLGMVSHELRTPLTAIKGSAATLLESSADLDLAEMREFHRIINEQADHMRDLIGNLLDVARIETGTLAVAPEPVAVALIVDEARSRFQSAGGRQNVHIDLAANLRPVMADRRRIVQVLDNLLSNASKFSPESSPIRITAKPENLHVAISVADEGRGMAVDSLPHLFTRFSRIHSDDRDLDPEGSGMGLPICQGIVEAHGGRIWAHSDGPDLGTRVTFTVPVADERETAATRAPSLPHSVERERPKILAVDDDPQALRYTRDVLTKAGYVPIVTGDPDDVPRLIKANDPALVLLDLMLPGSDGIDVMRRILTITDAPVIFLSAFGQVDVIVGAFDAGAVDYIVKPFSPTELTARIRAALRQRTALEPPEPPEPYAFGELTVNYAQRRTTLAGQPIRLTNIEYRLLADLSASAGRVVTYDDLLRRVWKLPSGSDLRPMRTAMKSLRQKLNDDANDPTFIFTETRTGYRMAKS